MAGHTKWSEIKHKSDEWNYKPEVVPYSREREPGIEFWLVLGYVGTYVLWFMFKVFPNL